MDMRDIQCLIYSKNGKQMEKKLLFPVEVPNIYILQTMQN